ncbi:MAG: GxxExxY protein [Ignavibacteria bacterium]
MAEIILKEESYKIIGICMEVHNKLGTGFLESVYKDAIEYEFFKSDIFFIREKAYKIKYKEIMLKHKFFADFVVFNKIILEVKCCTDIIDEHIKQTVNYLSVSNLKLGIIVNFGEGSLKYKRILL